MDHGILIRVLEKRIDDPKFIRLIKAMLKAGYLEDWQYHGTYSGTPQGGVCSPILSNIYLHELDRFMESMKWNFDSGNERREYTPHRNLRGKVERLRKTWKDADAEKRKEIRGKYLALKRELAHVPFGDPFDPLYQRLVYCRYADDFVIGIIGSKDDAEKVATEVKNFITAHLNLTVSEEKSKIVAANKGTSFLGYWIGTYDIKRELKYRQSGKAARLSRQSDVLQLLIPKLKAETFCVQKKYGDYHKVEGKTRAEALNLSEPEILLLYNQEMRGLANYYSLARKAKSDLNRLYRVWQLSLYATLAAKRKSSTTKVANNLRLPDGTYGIPYQAKDGTGKVLRIWRLADLQPVQTGYGEETADYDHVASIGWIFHRTEVVKRYLARKCEYCEDTTGPFAIHHVHKLKDLAKGLEDWQRLMSARQRKTLVLCRTCHGELHRGILPSRSALQKGVRGEPDDAKVSSPVRGGVYA